MPLTPVQASLVSRFARIRTGLTVGFDDEQMMISCRELRGGVWMSVPATLDWPFEDGQFEVVVMDGRVVSRELVREAHRVLLPRGCLFFTVNERTSKQEGLLLPEVYKLVREGFDIVELRRPKWWSFGRQGHTLTVCASKKNWRTHKNILREGASLFTPFRSRS